MSKMQGLSSDEVKELLVQFGQNSLPEPQYRLVKLIFRQVRGIFNLLLIVAAGITFALGEPVDGAIIVFFVLIGTVLNVLQEYKSNKAADKLKTYLLSTITIKRDGEDREVPTNKIVP